MYVAGFIIQESISSFYIHETSCSVSNTSSEIGLVIFFLNSSDNHSPIADSISQPRRLVRNY